MAFSRTADAPPRGSEPPVAAPEAELRALELAKRAAAGDLPAAQQLVAEVWPAITRLVGNVLGPNSSDFDDVVQQSLIALLRALPAFRGDCHPTGYACRIALRVALRARRQSQVEELRRKDLERLDSERPRPPSVGPGAERRRRLLRELLADLPEEQAEALALRVVLGWSLEEVAQTSGVPVNTVRSRVRLAKEALRRRIEAAPDLLEELELES
jgi:RNA polymerase sigma factor (sigma-70 family)